MINRFIGEYFFLSNFYETSITYEGISCLNNEAAFQSAKTTDNKIILEFASLNPSEAKRKGRSLKLREEFSGESV